MDMLEMSYRIPTHVLATQAGEDLAMLDIEQDRYLSLNKSGAKIWQLLSDGLTGREIVDRLSETYGIERSRLEQDTTDLLTQLAERGMIQMASDDATE